MKKKLKKHKSPTYNPTVGTYCLNQPLFHHYYRYQLHEELNVWCLTERTGNYAKLEELKKKLGRFGEFEKKPKHVFDLCYYDDPRSYKYDYHSAYFITIGDDTAFYILEQYRTGGVLNIFICIQNHSLHSALGESPSLNNFRNGKYSKEIEYLCGRSEFVDNKEDSFYEYGGTPVQYR